MLMTSFLRVLLQWRSVKTKHAKKKEQGILQKGTTFK